MTNFLKNWLITAGTLLCASAVAVLGLLASGARAHDTWVQTNTNLIRTGDAIHIDLMLGNHGNDHRDFKLASKVDPAGVKLSVLAPNGKSYDLQDRLVDLGYTPKEGFHSAKFVPAEPGLYCVVQTREGISHNTRGIKSGKTFFAVADDLNKVPHNLSGHDKALGHAIELVPTASPVTPMGPGLPIAVQVLYHGKPLVGARVSFIPRGAQLAEEFDPQFERKTAADGKASFIPKEGNWVLVVVHHIEAEQTGEGYDKTQYTATLTVFVPEKCPCCGE